MRLSDFCLLDSLIYYWYEFKNSINLPSFEIEFRIYSAFDS